MHQLQEDKVKLLSDRLNELGLDDSEWKEPVLKKLSEDISRKIDDGQNFHRASEELLQHFNKDVLAELDKINPGTISLNRLNLIKKVGIIAGLIFLALAVPALIMSLSLAFPLVVTGLFLLFFVVMPSRYVAGSINDRQEAVYRALFHSLQEKE